MKLGSQTVTLVSLSGTARDSMGNRIAVETATELPNCSFQPMRLEDKVSDTSFAASTHKCICPVTDESLAIRPEDRLIYNGVNHRIIGKRVWTGWNGSTDHVVIMCEEQSS